VGESYVRPVTSAREPAPEWHAVWRFRVVAILLLALVAFGATKGIDRLIHVGDQNPTAPSSPGP
jgi:hypothetical protein